MCGSWDPLLGRHAHRVVSTRAHGRAPTGHGATVRRRIIFVVIFIWLELEAARRWIAIRSHCLRHRSFLRPVLTLPTVSIGRWWELPLRRSAVVTVWCLTTGRGPECSRIRAIRSVAWHRRGHGDVALHAIRGPSLLCLPNQAVDLTLPLTHLVLATTTQCEVLQVIVALPPDSQRKCGLYPRSS